MTLSGSVAFLLYLLIYPIANRYFSTRWKYRILKMTVGFYLIPIAWFKFDIITEVYKIFPSLKSHNKMVVVDLTEYILSINDDSTIVPWKVKFIWLIVFIICILSVMIVYLQLYKYFKLKKVCLSQQAKHFTQKEMEMFETIKDTLGIKRKVKLLSSDIFDIPFTIGIFNPIIIIPISLKDQIKEFELQCIIKHELYHIKNHDLLFKFFSLLLIALHWFNPICYMVYQEVCSISELYCDFCTTKNMSLLQQKRYSNLIVDIAAEKKQKTKTTYIVPLVSKDVKSIERRIQELKKKRNTKNVILSGLIGTVICLAGSIPSFAYAPPVEFETPEVIEDETMEIIFYKNTYGKSYAESIPYDYFWTDRDGNIFEIAKRNSDEKVKCSHIFESGVVTLHSRNSDNSCKIVEKNAQICILCNTIKTGSIINTIYYDVCIH